MRWLKRLICIRPKSSTWLTVHVNSLATGTVLVTGILCKRSGFEVFAKIFFKNITIPSREIPFFGKAPTVLCDYCQIWFLLFSSDDLN
jgi:hypothetical protein